MQTIRATSTVASPQRLSAIVMNYEKSSSGESNSRHSPIIPQRRYSKINHPPQRSSGTTSTIEGYDKLGTI